MTHYNRSSSLERLLIAFDQLNCIFDDIVVSDDGSKREHIDRLRQLQEKHTFRLITTPRNKGLGNNINKGQNAVKSPYTLYVQEDFVPTALFPEKFQIALDHMEKKDELDLVRFYAYFKYPHLKKLGDGFAEMKFSVLPWFLGYKKFYFYSDHPHLRRSTFFQKFGAYFEGLKVERTEYRMMFSVLQNKGKALFYEDFQNLFIQKNSSEEPSTVRRNVWRESANPALAFCRHLYRYARFHWDYYFTPSTNLQTQPVVELSSFSNLDDLILSRAELADYLESLLFQSRVNSSQIAIR